MQLDFAALANNRLVASLLYNWVQPADDDQPNRVNGYSALLRYYLGSWSAVNIALHAEYSHRALGVNNPLKDDVFTLLLDFDFLKSARKSGAAFYSLCAGRVLPAFAF